MKRYRTAQDLPLDRKLKAAAGRLLSTLSPALAAKVQEKPFTHPWKPHERLVRNAIQHRAIAEKDHETLHHLLVDYWASPFSSEFFQDFGSRFEELFLKYHADIVTELGKQLSDYRCEDNIQLMELGCGDGQVLLYLSENLPQVGHFTGLDLSEEEIAKCIASARDLPKLTFSTIDPMAWLSSAPQGPVVLFTNGGVLEYFQREQLVALFNQLSANAPKTWVALTESLAIDHDLANESETYPYGHELAFSHNYPTILEECGFSLKWCHDRFTTNEEENHPSRWLQIVASK